MFIFKGNFSMIKLLKENITFDIGKKKQNKILETKKTTKIQRWRNKVEI